MVTAGLQKWTCRARGCFRLPTQQGFDQVPLELVVQIVCAASAAQQRTPLQTDLSEYCSHAGRIQLGFLLRKARRIGD